MSRAKTVTGGRTATTGIIRGGRALSVGDPGTGGAAGFAWKELGALARLESGHTPSRRQSHYWNGDVPWVGIRDATANHGRKIYSTNQTITEDGLANSSARLLPADTVCLSRTASVGYVVTMGVPMATSQDFLNWVCGPDLNPRYLHYLLVSEQASVRRFAHGTTHQTVYYPEAKAFYVCIPERPDQDAIAEVLGTLDDKLAANARLERVSTDLALQTGLEVLSQDPGKEVRLGDHAVIVKGASYKSSELKPGDGWLVSLKCIGRDGTFQSRGLKPYSGNHKPGQVLEHGDIVVAQTDLTQRAEVIGRPVRVQRLGAEGVLVASLDLAVVRPGEELTREILMPLLSTSAFHDHALSYCNGTTVLHLSARAIPDYRFRMPDQARLMNASERMRTLNRRSDGARSESAGLISLRDALLPALMSGELRLKTAEKIVEGAT